MMETLTIETKFIAGETGEIEGLAWPFGKGDRVGDWIEKGAFANVKLPLPILFSHDHADPLGAWESATETPEGLQVKGRLLVNDVARAKEVQALVKAGAVRGLSIGFITKAAKPREGGGRTITDLELLEISAVCVPMNAGAKITSAKSAIAAIKIAEAINRAATALKLQN